jgi:hypothetical protein
MNFYGHAVAASWFTTRPLFVLGSMLPDFATMCRNRVERVSDPEVAAGVAFHHLTDEVFHRTGAFVSLRSETTVSLCAEGLKRSRARAVAHAGVELLIDGALSTDENAREVFARSLAVGNRTRVIEGISWRTPNSRENWSYLLDRLRAADIPGGYADPDFVIDRVYIILAPRPALAVGPGDRPALERGIRSVHPRVAERMDGLVSELRRELRDAVPSTYRAGSEPPVAAFP